MSTETSPVVVGLGEVLWDCFDDSRRPGGAPANVAFHAGQSGCRGVVCSRVGADQAGEELCRFLEEQGLETTWLQRDPQRPTGRVSVDLSRPGHPDYTIHENVAWDAIEFEEPTRELMRRADAVCFGTLAQRSPVSRETIHRCLEATPDDCLIVYDVNLRQHWYRREWIERSLHAADIAKLNEIEAGVLAELLELPSADQRKFAAASIERFGLEIVCVTRAENGCLLVSADRAVDVPGREVEVADAVGAGDAFTAALIVARLAGRSIETTGRFANEVGALVAARPSAMPPLSDELRSLMTRYEMTCGDVNAEAR